MSQQTCVTQPFCNTLVRKPKSRIHQLMWDDVGRVQSVLIVLAATVNVHQNTTISMYVGVLYVCIW